MKREANASLFLSKNKYKFSYKFNNKIGCQVLSNLDNSFFNGYKRLVCVKY